MMVPLLLLCVGEMELPARPRSGAVDMRDVECRNGLVAAGVKQLPRDVVDESDAAELINMLNSVPVNEFHTK